jgi:hypothetical protein
VSIFLVFPVLFALFANLFRRVKSFSRGFAAIRRFVRTIRHLFKHRLPEKRIQTLIELAFGRFFKYDLEKSANRPDWQRKL